MRYLQIFLISFLSLTGFVSMAQEMVTTRNVDYVSEENYENDKDKLDIYAPKDAKKLPVLLFFHGGGLESGDKKDMEFAGERFVSEGIVVVFANYRLSPGVMHPVHMEDATRAFSWVKENIADYGGNPKNIFISGHSAGAYLAVLMGMDERYVAQHDYTLKDIAGVIGVSPFLYVEETAKVRNKTIWGTDPKVWETASVSPYISNGKPAMLLLYADGDDDWRKRHNETLAKALRKEGNSNIQVYEMEDRDHNSLWFKTNQPGDPTASLMIKMIKEN